MRVCLQYERVIWCCFSDSVVKRREMQETENWHPNKIANHWYCLATPLHITIMQTYYYKVSKKPLQFYRPPQLTRYMQFIIEQQNIPLYIGCTTSIGHRYRETLASSSSAEPRLLSSLFSSIHSTANYYCSHFRYIGSVECAHCCSQQQQRWRLLLLLSLWPLQ
jgi:hypothetical protein